MTDVVTLYTDGSCSPNPGRGGYAFIAISEEGRYSYSGREEKTTNNIMEMTAAIKGIELNPEYKKYIIYTDSTYLINGATGKHKRNKNLELWKELDKVCKDKEIIWNWVRGHNGDPNNESVDNLAKIARDTFE